MHVVAAAAPCAGSIDALDTGINEEPPTVAGDTGSADDDSSDDDDNGDASSSDSDNGAGVR